MAKTKVVDAVREVVSVLEGLDAGERGRVVEAALTLLGDESGEGEGRGITRQRLGKAGRGAGAVSEQAYFESKGPRTKVEELAVAARYREVREGATASTRADIQGVVVAARRNFDSSNFRRDLENARKNGLFTRGTGKDSLVLSHYGQGYVDAMPNRKAVKGLPRPRGAGRRVTKKRSPGRARG